MSVPGVASANVHVNMNTSGNFITAKLVGTGTDEATLAEALEGALPVMLEKTEDLKFGTFSTSIFQLMKPSLWGRMHWATPGEVRSPTSANSSSAGPEPLR